MQTQPTQTTIADAIIAEIEQEAATTRRLLEILPEDKLDWRPHPKAMSLGQLAVHIAQVQGGVAEFVDSDVSPRPAFEHATADNRDAILDIFTASTSKAKAVLAATSDEKALGEWRLVDGDKTLTAMPRVAFWRSIMLNHYYHHRGQLSTYLRQLDVPLPSIYGPTADVDPFA